MEKELKSLNVHSLVKYTCSEKALEISVRECYQTNNMASLDRLGIKFWRNIKKSKVIQNIPCLNISQTTIKWAKSKNGKKYGATTKLTRHGHAPN